MKTTQKDIKDFLYQGISIIVFMILVIFCLNLINRFVPSMINYLFGADTSSSNLPTCPDSEKIIIGYRNGEPMKICDQTYTFIFQDWNYSCMLTGNKDSGSLGFARSSAKSLGLSETDAIAIGRNMETSVSCDLGRISPELVRSWYSGKGDGSILTHSKTLGI